MVQQDLPELFICVTCRRSGTAPAPDGMPGDGRRLCDAVKSRLVRMGEEARVRLREISCFCNCERGCSVGIAQTGKWSYLMGMLGEEHAGDLIAYAQAYAASKSGVLLPSRRPDSLRDCVIARFPASVPFDEELA